MPAVNPFLPLPEISASQSFFPVAVGAIVTMHFMAILGQKLLKESLLFRRDEVRSG
jgi:hypothetical protein